MSEEDSKKEVAVSDDSDCGLSFYDELAERQGISVKAERSPMEEELLRDSLRFMKRGFDVKGRGGPSPSDLGEHEPIPLEAVGLVPMSATEATEEMAHEIDRGISDDLMKEVDKIIGRPKQDIVDRIVGSKKEG